MEKDDTVSERPASSLRHCPELVGRKLIHRAILLPALIQPKMRIK